MNTQSPIHGRRKTMSLIRRETCLAAAPYIAWMIFLFALPEGALSYALRTVVAAVALCAWFFLRGGRDAGLGNSPRTSLSSAVFWGVFAGVAVTVLWIFPEYLEFYRKWCVLGDVSSPLDAKPSPYAPENCGWPLTILRLFGSAFIIAPAEEIFFRHFLYRRLQHEDWVAVDSRRFDWPAFLWMVGLFALEHNRIVAAVMAGAVYGLVYIRRGLLSAILAHVLTNLLLALYVIETGAWTFW